MVHVAIVGAHVQEVIALGIVLTVEHGGIGFQLAVQVGSHHIHACMIAVGLIAHVSAKGCVLQIVFLLDFRFRTMIARGDDGGCRPVVIERRIHRPIGDEACGRQSLGDIDGGRRPLQIAVGGTGGMGPEGTRRATHVLQHRHLAKTEAVV